MFNALTYIIIESLQSLGRPILIVLVSLGKMVLLAINLLASIGYCVRHMFSLVKEINFVGAKSVIIIALSGWFVGMVLGLQGYNTLQRFGSVNTLGAVVALSLLRELSPVLTAILFASRAGTAITAAIGLMKATEQLDAMTMMAVDPVKHVLAPKFFASVLSMPLLSALFSSCGIFGGYFIGVFLLGLDSGDFWSQMRDSVSLHADVIDGIIKSVVFAVMVGLIATYQGFTAKPTADGVAIATTKTVVYSAIVVLCLDFILTSLMF